MTTKQAMFDSVSQWFYLCFDDDERVELRNALMDPAVLMWAREKPRI